MRTKTPDAGHNRTSGVSSRLCSPPCPANPWIRSLRSQSARRGRGRGLKVPTRPHPLHDTRPAGKGPESPRNCRHQIEPAVTVKTSAAEKGQVGHEAHSTEARHKHHPTCAESVQTQCIALHRSLLCRQIGNHKSQIENVLLLHHVQPLLHVALGLVDDALRLVEPVARDDRRSDILAQPDVGFVHPEPAVGDVDVA